MTDLVDLRPAAAQLATLVRNVTDEQLGAPTPCPSYTLGDLVEHVGGLAQAFTWAATKTFPDDAGGSGAPVGDASRLPDDWRERIPRDLAALGEAWRAADAWTGMTKAGGIDMPGEIGGLVALDELVVHGWDVAKASGQRYKVDDTTVAAARQFVGQFAEGNTETGDDVAFGKPVAVGSDASPLDQLVALTGRDPSWSPPRA